MWQGLDPSNPHTLLTVDYNTETLVGEDADCMSQGSNADFICGSAHSFFNSLARSRYLSFFSLSLSFILWSTGTATPQFCKFSFFADYHKVWFSSLDCMSKSHRSLCVLFSRTNVGLCIFDSFGWSNLNFLHISRWIILLIQSCLVLYSFGANLLHLLIMRLMVSSLSPHSLHLIFCCVISIFAWI